MKRAPCVASKPPAKHLRTVVQERHSSRAEVFLLTRKAAVCLLLQACHTLRAYAGLITLSISVAAFGRYGGPVSTSVDKGSVSLFKSGLDLRVFCGIRYDRNIACLARRRHALEVGVIVARIAPSVLDLGRGDPTGSIPLLKGLPRCHYVHNLLAIGDSFLIGSSGDLVWRWPPRIPLVRVHMYQKAAVFSVYCARETQNAEHYAQSLVRPYGVTCGRSELCLPPPPGAAVAKRLACLPPTRAIRVQFPGRVTPDFRMWESCRTIPLVGGFFSGNSRFSPALSFRRCSMRISITLIGSQGLDVNFDEDGFPIVMHCSSLRPQALVGLWWWGNFEVSPPQAAVGMTDSGDVAAITDPPPLVTVYDPINIVAIQRLAVLVEVFWLSAEVKSGTVRDGRWWRLREDASYLVNTRLFAPYQIVPRGRLANFPALAVLTRRPGGLRSGGLGARTRSVDDALAEEPYEMATADSLPVGGRSLFAAAARSGPPAIACHRRALDSFAAASPFNHSPARICFSAPVERTSQHTSAYGIFTPLIPRTPVARNQQICGTPFDNQRLVTCIPACGPVACRECFSERGSQLDTRPVPTASHNQSMNGYARTNETNHLTSSSLCIFLLCDPGEDGTCPSCGRLWEIGRRNLCAGRPPEASRYASSRGGGGSGDTPPPSPPQAARSTLRCPPPPRRPGN
ncbi:hypothetical protein PR048_006971 [Dryococelus australis]|uniref:Uncharacterized protein n=1 Tax=Dryococelus australis TaxID=614101 RepID=A0ABQ9ICE7_9NEOP|nr:hypothetical protein PR048_006971 [Dryococelus australis]